MKDILIHNDFLHQFMRCSHMNIYLYILVNADDNGVFKGCIEDVAEYVDLPVNEVRFIIDKNLNLEENEDGILICEYQKFLPVVETVPEVEEETEVEEDGELVLTSEKTVKARERKVRKANSPKDIKFQESMEIFYPNVAKMKVPLTLAEYNILCKFVAECGKLNFPCANELLIDVLQQLDASPTLKKKNDAYKTVRNWLNIIMRNRTFSFDYYRNINIEARKNERNAIKAARR